MSSEDDYDVELIACIPTLCAKNFIFRLLNALPLVGDGYTIDRLIINDSRSMSVAEKWNQALAIGCAEEKPVLFLNDDIIPWPGAIDKIVASEGDFVTGKTTSNLPGEGDPEQASTGGFSFFLVWPSAIETLAGWEADAWFGIDRPWDGYVPGFFDPNFRPAYFEDSDFFYRMKLAGIQEVVADAHYYHELTPTKTGRVFAGCTTNLSDPARWDKHAAILKNNQRYYIEKWGGAPHEEEYLTPWDLQ